jgi:hypothetical protein
MKGTFIRGCLALVMAAGPALTVTTTAPAAESGAASAAACPAKGTRFMTGSGPEIYLVGPGHNPDVSRLYWVPDMDTYDELWGGRDGIQTLPGVLNCWTRSYPLQTAHLVQAPGNPRIYIWDVNEGFRWIVDWATFASRYHFDPAEIGSASQGTIDGALGPNWT